MNISTITTLLWVHDGTWKDGHSPKTFQADKKWLVEYHFIEETDDPESEGYYLLKLTKRGEHAVKAILGVMDDHLDCVIEEDEEESSIIDKHIDKTDEERARAERWKNLALKAKTMIYQLLKAMKNDPAKAGNLVDNANALCKDINNEEEEED